MMSGYPHVLATPPKFRNFFFPLVLLWSKRSLYWWAHHVNLNFSLVWCDEGRSLFFSQNSVQPSLIFPFCLFFIFLWGGVSAASSIILRLWTSSSCSPFRPWSSLGWPTFRKLFFFLLFGFVFFLGFGLHHSHCARYQLVRGHLLSKLSPFPNALKAFPMDPKRLLWYHLLHPAPPQRLHASTLFHSCTLLNSYITYTWRTTQWWALAFRLSLIT